MAECYLHFEINIYNDGDEKSFKQRADSWISDLKDLCIKHEVYYGGTSSFREKEYKEEYKKGLI